jgi:hypothetical protein
MPARDIFHDAVSTALQKDGWTITDDPLFIDLEDDKPFYIDLAAEKVVAAQKGDSKIAVEIKSFLGSSLSADFHLAVGQFINYRTALEIIQSERILYLAIRSETYKEYFTRKFPQAVINAQRLRLIVFDVSKEEIIQWLE